MSLQADPSCQNLILTRRDLAIIFQGKIMAEREGFEPSIPFWSMHAFQACAFNHSAISPAGSETLAGRRVGINLFPAGSGQTAGQNQGRTGSDGQNQIVHLIETTSLILASSSASSREFRFRSVSEVAAEVTRRIQDTLDLNVTVRSGF